ncbi:MAG: hypothetical protein R2873_36165 [Caldilineaceae bacterium]|nr:hypothetical protein [Caldilineaceae bacterium]
MLPLLRALVQVSRRLSNGLPGAALSAPTPTLPIIFISLFAGIGSSVLGYYVAYAVLTWSTFWSVAAATLILTAAVSGTAAFLSSLHDPRTIGVNIGFSCALTFLLLAFVGFCMVVGILAATVVMML